MSEKPKRHKRQHAVALQYQDGDRTPHIIATGAGYIAERIIALAQEHNVPVREDDNLADMLSRLPVGSDIPPETYRVVAEILAFLYRTDEAWRRRKSEQFSRLENPAPPQSTPKLEGA